MITLEKVLQEASHNGHITDEKEIARILEQMSDMPLGEILDAITDQDTKEMARLVAEVLCEEFGLCEGDVRVITYTDIIYMLRQTKIVSDGVSFRYQGIYWLRRMFQDARGSSVPISRYLSVSPDRLFWYLSKMDPKAVDVVFGRYRDACAALDAYRTDWNIGEALEELRRRGEVVWKPHWNWESYRRKTHEMYQGWKCLLMDPFRVAYPGKFCLENIAYRYYCMAREE